MKNKIYLFLRNQVVFFEQKKEAKKTYNIIKKQTKYKISKQQKKDINEYCKTVLRSKRFKPWIKVYTIYNQEFKWGWMPDDYFELYIMPRINPFGQMTEIKTLTKRILNNAEEFPDAYYVIGGLLYNTDLKIVSKDAILDEPRELFYKKNTTNQVREISKINKEKIDSILNSKNNDGVIQYIIKQHDWFLQFMPNNVCTVRITTTYLNDDKPKFHAAWLKIDRSTSQSIKSKNNLKVPVVNMNGDLGKYALDFENETFIAKYPDTRTIFEGKTIPYFKKMADRCIELHKSFPYFGIISWDCIIDSNNNMRILDWNANHPSIKEHELFVGPCFDLDIFNLKLF